MAAYEINIIEIVAEKLSAGRGLKSPELRYEQAPFLKWLQDNISKDEVQHASFKQACLVNGVKLTDYDKYFADKERGILDYILQENVLQHITINLINKQPLEEIFPSKEEFGLSPEDATEIITIVNCALAGRYTPAIAVTQCSRFFETAGNDFLETRNTLYYNIALKEMAHLQSDLKGSILDDLKRGLEIIILTIELTSYDLSSFWNKEINFIIDGSSQKNSLPGVLYNYYIKLTYLLALANRSVEPDKYERDFMSEIEPFFKILNQEKIKEAKSRFTKSLSPHYQRHIQGVDFLYRLPKQVHEAEEAARSQNAKAAAQPSAESVAPQPHPLGNATQYAFSFHKRISQLGSSQLSSSQLSSSQPGSQDTLNKELAAKFQRRKQLESQPLEQNPNEQKSDASSSSVENSPLVEQTPNTAATQSSSIGGSSNASSEKTEGKKEIPSGPNRAPPTWFTVLETMPANTSNIRDGYLLIKTSAKALYRIQAGDLTSTTIKDDALLENMLQPAVTNRLKKLEEYSFNWIETLELWQSLNLTPENKIIALIVIDDKLHCKIGLPNRNVIELTLENIACSAENLAKIKEQPLSILKEICAKIETAHLLFPIGLTPVEMRALNQSIGQSAAPAAKPPMPNRMSFHGGAERGLPPPLDPRRSVQLPKREPTLTNTDVPSSGPKFI